MRKLLPCVVSILFAAAPILTEARSASDESKDDDRLRNCGTVLKEILDVPDNIPHDLLDKADCVVVFPSVLKAAFIVGGSYGRGAMSCRKGDHFRGPWGAPTMMALEGGSFGLQIGGKPRILSCLLWTRVARGGFSPARSNWEATLPWRPGRLAAMHRPRQMQPCVPKS